MDLNLLTLVDVSATRISFYSKFSLSIINFIDWQKSYQKIRKKRKKHNAGKLLLCQKTNLNVYKKYSYVLYWIIAFFIIYF